MLIAVHRAYRGTLESDPELFDLLIASLTKERPAAQKHRSRVQHEIQRVYEDGVASGAFAFADRRRAMALIFDAAHRFVHPAALKLDRNIPAASLAARFEILLSLVLRALRSGRA